MSIDAWLKGIVAYRYTRTYFAIYLSLYFNELIIEKMYCCIIGVCESSLSVLFIRLLFPIH